MWYTNKNILTTAMSLMINSTQHLQLMANIKKAFDSVDLKTIDDVDIRRLAGACKTFSEDIFNKAIKIPTQARMYFDESSLDKDIKAIIKDNDTVLSDIMVDEFSVYFAKVRLQPDLNKVLEYANSKFELFSKSGISDVTTNTHDFISSINSLTDITKDLTKDVLIRQAFVVNPDSESNVDSFGMEHVEQNILEANNGKLSTSTFMDNITGGGFNTQSLYIVSSIAGGFKSGFLQNMAEAISKSMRAEDFILPTGSVPAILYVNLEMSEIQMLRRKIDYYGESPDGVIYGDDEYTEHTLQERVRHMLNKHNSNIPVLYQRATAGYSVNTLKSDIQQYERDGYKIICIITDYMDLFKYEPGLYDIQERIEPIVSKAKQQRDLAIEFKVPVLTGAQLNREGETLKDGLDRAATEDLIKRVNSGMLAKGHQITTIPEQIYCVYKFNIGDDSYFSLVVDKDRDNSARYIDPNNGKDKTPTKPKSTRARKDGRITYVAKMDGFKISNNYSNTIKHFTGDMEDPVSILSVSRDDV